MKKIALITLLALPLIAENKQQVKPREVRMECVKKDVSPVKMALAKITYKTGLHRTRCYRLISTVTPVIKNAVINKIQDIKNKIMQKINS